ncbi:unnamed protein product [Tuber aestivum]|uniref:Uncharacterized protein n=1 Tax=Tuber aestivum TaxID=59557 RepID=A0A292Q541_9PEZI|nr:unnamed protein product [Tuber aestivum]
MLAANKENALNAHVPHLGRINARTPGPSKLHPKTPYKVPLNNENVARKAGKQTLFVGNESSQFVTPIGEFGSLLSVILVLKTHLFACEGLGGGSRRPALTGKTTNAKARIFISSAGGSFEQQPKPAGGISRPDSSRRSIPEDVRPVLHSENGEYPEIEYMPQCPPDLSDIPDDFSAPDYDKLGKSIYRGCHRQFLLDIDEFGRTCIERQVEASQRQIDAMLDAETEELLKPLSLRSSGAAGRKKIAYLSSGPSSTKQEVGKTAPAKPTVTKRPTSRSASALGRSSSTASGQGSSTNRAVKSMALFSKRPASSSSNVGPKAASRTASHSRSISASTIKKPLSFPTRPKAMPPPRPESRTLSAANYGPAIGHTRGKEGSREVKRRVQTTGPKETALEACERVLHEHEEDFSPVILPPLGTDGGDCEDPVIMPPIDDIEEEFYMQVPE